MSVISEAISEIRARVPEEVLNAAFGGKIYSRFTTMTSMDEAIRATVIERIKMLCDNVGGTQAVIPLDQCEVEVLDVWNTVIRVPKKSTNGRRIVSALNVTLFTQSTITSPYWQGYMQNNTHVQLDAAKQVMNSYMPVPSISSAYVSLIGENVILINGNGWRTQSAALTVVLENEAEFGNIRPAFKMAFFELVEHAAKAYIYKTLKPKLDQGALVGGFEIGAIKEIVESYADEEKMFQDYLENKWRKKAIMNDPLRSQFYRKISTGKY